MKTSQLISTIGPVIQTRIIADKHGDANLHEKGYISCDPCYIIPRHEWTEFLHALYSTGKEQMGDEWEQWLRAGWRPVPWKGRFVLCRSTGGDGCGFFGLCTDTGTNAIFPTSMFPEVFKEVQA